MKGKKMKDIYQTDIEVEEPTNLLRVDVIAKQLGLTNRAVHNLAKSFKCRVYKPTGGSTWYDFNYIRRMIEKSEVKNERD